MIRGVLNLALAVFVSLCPSPARAADPNVRITKDAIEIETDALVARIQTKGYVSGIAAGGLLDKKTEARDLGFGLHIMDFLMAPGWRDDGYSRDAEAARQPAQALRRRAANLHAGQGAASPRSSAARASSPSRCASRSPSRARATRRARRGSRRSSSSRGVRYFLSAETITASTTWMTCSTASTCRATSGTRTATPLSRSTSATSTSRSRRAAFADGLRPRRRSSSTSGKEDKPSRSG